MTFNDAFFIIYNLNSLAQYILQTGPRTTQHFRDMKVSQGSLGNDRKPFSDSIFSTITLSGEYSTL